METLISKNPATGEVLEEIPFTTKSEIQNFFARSKIAQEKWAQVPVYKRSHILRNVREVLIRRADELIEIISKENGKPKFEALGSEVFPLIELITYFAKRAPHVLADKRIPMRLMKHRKSYLNHWPLGTVLVISPWNFPVALAAGDIVMALLAGNAVVFKPSEVTPLIAKKLVSIFEEGGLPRDLLQIVIGDGKTGAACIDQRPAKIFFTGSVATGKRVMAHAAQYLIPVNLELGGKDPMIILPDADLDYASSAALWGCFTNSGQVCASIERIIIHESIAEEFLKRFHTKVNSLRQGDPANENVDLGAITFEKQKSIYDEHISEASTCGAKFVSGGEFSADRRFLRPTIVSGPDVEKLKMYNEETFGPVVAVTTYRTIDEAVEKANHSRYGLLASVIAGDLKLGESVARRIEAGTVTLNEAVYTHALAETPWGGVKDSGFGRTHSEAGLIEFVNVRHVHVPRSKLFVFKSLWWYPYTPHQYKTFRLMIELYRKHITDKLRVIPELLFHFIEFIKDERRL